MPSATARGGAPKAWTRDKIIKALRRYADLYGEDFTAASFSPSSAKWNDHPELAARYFAGDPDTGERWPSLNAVKGPFEGSFNKAKIAAGLPVNRPGPARGKRAAGTAAPIRDVRHITRTVYFEKDGGETRARLERATARAERLSAKVERLEARLAERPKPQTITKTKTKTKTRTVKVTDQRVIDRLTAKLDAARDAEKLARVDLAEARQAASRAASKLERAEATIHSLRDERRDLKRELGRAEDRENAALAEIERLRAREPETVTVERVQVIEKQSPEAAAVREAERTAARAEKEAQAADLRAAKAERELHETVAAIKGVARKLTPKELAELRTQGPAGPVVLARALKALGAARVTSNPTALRAALAEVARAAVTWQERI